MQAEAKREIEELEQMEKEDETAFGEDGFWTQKAIQRIRDIAETYDTIGDGPARQANLAHINNNTENRSSRIRILKMYLINYNSNHHYHHDLERHLIYFISHAQHHIITSHH